MSASGYMSEKKQLIESLIKSFCDDSEAERIAHQTLQKYSTEWIQSHHVVLQMNGTIEKFEIHGQSNKYKALRSLFNHYQETQDHKDENYANIIHLLLQTSHDELNQNNDKTFRDLTAIIEQIETNKIDNKENIDDILFSFKSSDSEWEREWQECDEELSEWSDDPIKNDDIKEDKSILEIKSCKNKVKNDINDVSSKELSSSILCVAEVTRFECLISALMGVDTIYFKWRKNEFVCLGSDRLMTENCSLLHYANYYRNCQNVMDHISNKTAQTALCIKSFFNIIWEFLQIYRENLNWFVSSKYYKTQSILELSYFMSQSFSILECIHKDIIHYFYKEIMSSTLKTHHLISHLFQLLLDILCDEYSVKSSTVMSLFLATISPYFDILDEWLFNGRLIDPFKEFFIEKVRNKESNIWNKYILCSDRIPCFLFENGIAESILINGKSLQILRYIQRQTNKECKLPSKPYESSFQCFQSILSKYYPLEFCIECINPEQKQTTDSSPKNMLILSPKKKLSQIMFATPQKDNKKQPINITNSNDDMLDPIQMMTWINTTNQIQPIKELPSPSPLPSKNPLYLNYVDHGHIEFIQKEMVYIPFQHIIRGQLLPKIEKYCFDVNQLLLDTIDLLPHLTELRLFYFIEASDILYSLLPTLIDILSSPGWGKQLRISEALQTAIQDSVYCDKLPFDERISVEWSVNIKEKESKEDKDHLASVVYQINKLLFGLSVEWPLNIVITPSIIDSYNRIFKFLLQLKASKLMLEKLDVEIRAKSKIVKDLYDDDVIHKYVTFRYRLYLFINTFNNYCCLQIDTKQWNELICDIINHCYGLDEIQKKHNLFLEQTLQNLFLENKMISSHIIHLLLCCHDLLKMWKTDIIQYIQFKQEIIKIKQSSRFQHENNKLWRLKETALNSISMMNVKFDRMYKFCLVTIHKIKNKSLTQTAINVVLHLDFNNFYSNLFQIPM